MFTGIVTCRSPVAETSLSGGILRLVVTVPDGFTEGLTQGASVAVNGCCLTVVGFDATSIAFDVIDESLRLTNLGALTVGAEVNLERAARFGDEIGGHPLSGHIHTCATLAAVQRDQDNVAMKLEVDEAWMPYVISKGYIAINGCSLTIGVVEGNAFWLHLIPETLRVTNLESYEIGSALNVEIDHQTQVIVDTVDSYMKRRDGNP
ncbi:MAG: riboflavin synthase subunit alpha [Myxococcota bacterium]|nr:riboflavin synthase subunit alpha [Myxococcota bacterium]